MSLRYEGGVVLTRRGSTYVFHIYANRYYPRVTKSARVGGVLKITHTPWTVHLYPYNVERSYLPGFRQPRLRLCFPRIGDMSC